MIVSFSRSRGFQSAHFLPLVAESHKCRNMHGHSYKIRLWLRGPVGADGFVVDNARIDKFLGGVCWQLDHKCLNELSAYPFSENPTAENLLEWILGQAQAALGEFVFRVDLHEGPDSVFSVEVPCEEV